MTQAATNLLARPVIKISSNMPELRICFLSGRAVSTIQKMPNGKYVVVKVYENSITECNRYSEARKEAEGAAMFADPDKAPSSKTGLKTFHKSDRITSFIQKNDEGKYIVVKLYEEEVTECSHHKTAEKEATGAAMKQAPRTTKDAA